MTSASLTVGNLRTEPALSRLDLVADPTAELLRGWPPAHRVAVARIDPADADTATFTRAHQVPAEVSANCVVVGGRRAGQERIAACVVLASTRADVNGTVRRLLDVRKASFLAMTEAVELTGMEYGGITPVGLPPAWRILVDERVLKVPAVVVGSGVRGSKLVLPGADLALLPRAEPVPDLATT